MSTSQLVKPIPGNPLDQKRGPFKFIPRNLHISNTNYLALQKIRLKGLYLRKLIDERSFDYYEIEAEEEITYKTFKNKKLFKTLKHLKVPCAYRSYIHDSFKYSRNLKSFSLKSDLASRLSRVAFSIRRLPKQVQMIRLRVREYEHVTNSNIYEVAKSIRVFHRLKYFYRWYELGERNDTPIPRELRTYDDSVSRLKNLEKIIYNPHHDELRGLQRAMIRGSVFPRITGLKLSLLNERFPDQDRQEEEAGLDEEIWVNYENLTKTQEPSYRLIRDAFRMVYGRKEDDPEYPPRLAKLRHNQEETKSESAEPQVPLEMDQNFLRYFIKREKTRQFY